MFMALNAMRSGGSKPVLEVSSDLDEMEDDAQKDLKGMLKDKTSAHTEFPDMYFDYKVTQDETLATEKEIEDEMVK